MHPPGLAALPIWTTCLFPPGTGRIQGLPGFSPPPCPMRPQRGRPQRDEAIRPCVASTAMGAGADRANRVTQTHHGGNHRAIPLPSPPLRKPLRKSRTGLNPVPQSPSEQTRMAPISSRNPQQGTPTRLQFVWKNSSISCKKKSIQ